ncbi:hypothetical protein CCACVL1_22120 [Corchorus capsularis]|uniref:Protein kinase domain-containing protein n=1 Tax=Corchorus capsularis TaxID=210143 RepID=A0A1R3H0Y9_COCAP|nr:hypothetical protein CCACVL1_22120 [Corchorus capsularis]
MSISAPSNPSGALGNFCSFLVRVVVVLSCAISIANADSARKLLQAPAESPARVPEGAPPVSDLPLPSNLPLIHKPHQRHSSPLSAPTVLAPGQPPFYGPLITSSHPPTSPRLSKPLMKRSASVPPAVELPNIAPTQISPGTIPAGLAEPPLSPEVSNCCKRDSILKRGTHGCHCVYPIKLDLLLLNVSQNPNWNVFLAELASQLDLLSSQIEIINFYVPSLSRLNISMDITPHTGISFSASDASKINSTLVMHRVHFDPNVVGDYKVLNLTWFEPPVPAPAPIVASEPVAAPAHQSSISTSPSPSNKGKHSNLILIFGISAGILVFAIISVLIICSCTFHEGKPKASPKESVKLRTIDAVARAGSLPHPSSTRFLQYEELKEATNNFSPASILGEGGFGRVFKGVLSDGTAVAIKRLTSGGPQGDKEFLVEVEMLSRLHHRNLVKLVGYYSSRESSQNLLCYELVPNGSLEAWLHGPLGARPILRDKDRLEELADPRLGGKYPKEDFIRVCTIAAACVAPEASQRPTMGEVVQSLKMVQRVTEYQDSMLTNNRPNQRQSSTTFESDETSSMFSSGPYSGLSVFDNDNISRTAVSSEDLHEGR